jgi:hypothetical protein
MKVSRNRQPCTLYKPLFITVNITFSYKIQGRDVGEGELAHAQRLVVTRY